ncbi:MAG: DNA replication and repair protein RecF [Dehalococcoidia bacterium]
MHLTGLTLDQFRSYGHLDLSLPPGLTLVSGANASGKSNLLEAIYTLAATRSPRTSIEGELLAWDAPHPPVLRIAGTAARSDGPVTVEIALSARTDAAGAVRLSKSGAPLTSKRIRLNGVPRRATDAIGQIAAVLFTTLDIEIITGSPSARRRYLDLTISQYDRAYARALSRLDRALSQRNALLKRIAAREAAPGELEPWDETLAAEGAAIVAARADAVQALTQGAAERHRCLTASDPQATTALNLVYEPALGKSGLPDLPSAAAIEERLRSSMLALRPREIGAGATLVGPHRDDLAIRLDHRAAAAYASRAQQRSIALALRLAEADLLSARNGEPPILLLDDILSELDPARRAATARSLGDSQQVILTTADTAAVPAELPAPAAGFRVLDNQLVPAKDGA